VSVQLPQLICEPAKMAELIEMPFGKQICVGARNLVLGMGARRRYLVKVIERSM